MKTVLASIGALAVLIVLMSAMPKSKKRVPAALDFPEEWLAITTDTMEVVRVEDTLYLYFINPIKDTTK
jgi:hypothetical protein